MKIHFYKYQGTGNDFIIIDNRTLFFNKENKVFIEKICNRRFGIGADGLMLLENYTGLNFNMVYFNSDGNTSSMCGNGGRCIAAFAKKIGIGDTYLKFMAPDGEHEALIIDDIVSLKMNDVDKIKEHKTYTFLNTGSPHYIAFVDNINELDVFKEGRKIRNSKKFVKEGVNVNFIQEVDKKLVVRTYERGVENETFSCGTGVTAAALVFALKNNSQDDHCDIKTLGGDIKVRYTKNENGKFENIWLEGPAEFVFEGDIEI